VGFGLGGLSLFLAGLALAQAIAFARHLKDVYVGSGDQKRAGQVRSEAKGFPCRIRRRAGCL